MYNLTRTFLSSYHFSSSRNMHTPHFSQEHRCRSGEAGRGGKLGEVASEYMYKIQEEDKSLGTHMLVVPTSDTSRSSSRSPLTHVNPASRYGFRSSGHGLFLANSESGTRISHRRRPDLRHAGQVSASRRPAQPGHRPRPLGDLPAA